MNGNMVCRTAKNAFEILHIGEGLHLYTSVEVII
jgi:hypothetical protein